MLLLNEKEIEWQLSIIPGEPELHPEWLRLKDSYTRQQAFSFGTQDVGLLQSPQPTTTFRSLSRREAFWSTFSRSWTMAAVGFFALHSDLVPPHFWQHVIGEGW